jgi:hypothetical protein
VAPQSWIFPGIIVELPILRIVILITQNPAVIDHLPPNAAMPCRIASQYPTDSMKGAGSGPEFLEGFPEFLETRTF